jgi:hypothetical protein
MIEYTSQTSCRIIKLVDDVNRASRLLATTLERTVAADCPLRMFEEKVRERLGQFEFELRIELNRLAGESIALSDPPDPNLRCGFDMMLDSYRQALSGNLKAHTRAMVTRQFREVQRIYAAFVAIQRAA